MFLKKKSHNLVTKPIALVLKGVKGSAKVKETVKVAEVEEVTPKKASKKGTKNVSAE